MVERLFSHFLLATLIVSLVIAFALIIKCLLKRALTAQWQYRIDKLLLVSLLFPFIPVNVYIFFGVNIWFKKPSVMDSTSNTAVDIAGQEGGALADRSAWLQDLSLSVDRFAFNEVFAVLGVLWLIGAAVVTTICIVSNRDLHLIKESAVPVVDEVAVTLFGELKTELGVKKSVRFVSSILVKSPVTIGLLKPYVILPSGLDKKISPSNLRGVLLHELTHCKNGDIHVNALMCILQVVYWFNPVVYLLLKTARTDRELSCDQLVIGRLGRTDCLNYGKALISFTNDTRSSNLSITTNMSGTKKQIKGRIEAIASNVYETRLMKAKGLFALCLLGVIVFSQVPVIAAFASDSESVYQLEEESVIYEDMASYFEGFDGSFVLYDLNADEYRIYNKENSESRISPGSTYKIYSALIAMETGTISDGSSIKEWDGIMYPFDSWNKTHDLESAMKNSVNWYFQGLDERIGKDTLEAYYTQLGYGNHNLSGDIESYWMESSLKISPIEQVFLLKNVYEYDTLFKDENVDALKRILTISTKKGRVLSGKTGTGTVNNQMINGWFIGCVENEDNSYYFAVNIQGDDGANGSSAAEIALEILADKGIF